MKTRRTSLRILSLTALVLAAISAGSSFALADDDGDDDGENRDAVLSSVERGEILPLSTIRKRVTDAYPGDIVDIDIVRHHGAIRYRFKVLTPEGVLKEVVINAVDGTVLKVENHD